MDWLRSEDLKEEKVVTTPVNHSNTLEAWCAYFSHIDL
jgi:hypothetical protein